MEFVTLFMSEQIILCNQKRSNLKSFYAAPHPAFGVNPLGPCGRTLVCLLEKADSNDRLEMNMDAVLLRCICTVCRMRKINVLLLFSYHHSL